MKVLLNLHIFILLGKVLLLDDYEKATVTLVTVLHIFILLAKKLLWDDYEVAIVTLLSTFQYV